MCQPFQMHLFIQSAWRSSELSIELFRERPTIRYSKPFMASAREPLPSTNQNHMVVNVPSRLYLYALSFPSLSPFLLMH